MVNLFDFIVLKSQCYHSNSIIMLHMKIENHESELQIRRGIEDSYHLGETVLMIHHNIL